MKKPRTRKDMVNYLLNHFRYDTMNSWNQSTSYAANVKIYNIIPVKYRDVAYNIYDHCMDIVYNDINDLIREFEYKYEYSYQIGFNGRSSGYMVLYHGGKNSDGTYFSYPGKDFDMNEDFQDWELSELRERVSLVYDFDLTVKKCIALFLDYCKNYKVESHTETRCKDIEVFDLVPIS